MSTNAPIPTTDATPARWRDLYIEGHFCGRTDSDYEVGMGAMMDSRPHPTEYRPNGTFVVTEITDERVTMEREP